jgi:hypothetical protein
MRDLSHDSIEANLGLETQSRLARGYPGWETQSRLVQGHRWARRTHDSLETNFGRETQSRLERGQPRAGDAIMTHPRPTPGDRRSYNSSRPISCGDTVTARPMPTPDKQHISNSSEGRGHLQRCSNWCSTPLTSSVRRTN